jgi:predicted kinase
VGLSGRYLKSKYHPDIIVSPDNIRREFTGNISDHSQEVRVWNEVRKRVNSALESVGEAVLDATNVDSGLRGKFLKNYPGVEKIALVFRTNPEVAKQRVAKDLSGNVDRSAVPPEVIDNQYKKLMNGYGNLQHQFDKMKYVTEGTMKRKIIEYILRYEIKKILKEMIPNN